MYRIFFKGFLVLIFFSNSIFLNAQIVGVFIHIEPSFFINVGRVDSSLYLLNNVKKETQKLTKINDDVEFSHKIINYFDSSGNKILQNYFLNDSLVSFQELHKQSTKTYHKKQRTNKKTNSKNEIKEEIYYNILKIERDSFGNKKEFFLLFINENDTIKINYDYNYKLKNGKSTMYLNGVKYLRSMVDLNINNKIELEKFYSLDYNSTSYLDLQKAEPYWVEYFEYYENGLTKSFIAKSDNYTYIAILEFE